MSENIAGLVSHYYSPLRKGPKRLKTIREISRQYTGLIDVPAAWVQALNEIRFAEGRHDGECSLLRASKGIVGALTAIARVLDTVLQRGSADPELKAHAIHLANAIKLLVCIHSQIQWDRKQSVNKVVHTRLGKELLKINGTCLENCQNQASSSWERIWVSETKSS